MIVITGALGFIGSCLVGKFNQEQRKDLVLVDSFKTSKQLIKFKNLIGKKYHTEIDLEHFPEWLVANATQISFIYHLGACTDTTEQDQDKLNRLNLHYSQKLWQLASKFSIPFVYASSAATYGDGTLGYDDQQQSLLPKLQPLNFYGWSKQDFDLWALAQQKKPPYWAGLKFFNVYGPNEYHKGKMASVVLHCFEQIKQCGSMRLFRSHHPDFKDGEQSRDFIYVKDVMAICYFLLKADIPSGIYNVGTGEANTFLNLVLATFQALDREPKIEFIDTPLSIRENYQYFTQASMDKLITAGYSKSFYSLSAGVTDYVTEYLLHQRYI